MNVAAVTGEVMGALGVLDSTANERTLTARAALREAADGGDHHAVGQALNVLASSQGYQATINQVFTTAETSPETLHYVIATARRNAKADRSLAAPVTPAHAHASGVLSAVDV